MGEKRLRLSAVVAALLLISPLLLSACGKETAYSVEERLDRAREARSSGELRTAILELKNALKQNPDSSAARYLLGQIYIDMENGGAAEKELTLARQLGVDEVAIVVPMSQAWILQGEYQKVIDEVAISSNIPTGSQAALRAVHGDAYMGLGRFGDADTSYKMAAGLEPQDPSGFVGQANVALARKDVDGAKAYYAKALAIDAGNMKVITLAGDIASAEGDFKSAAKSFEKLVKARPENIYYRTVYAWTLTNLGDFKAAGKNADRVLAIVPDYPPANHIKALIAFKQKDYRAAFDFSERVLAVEGGQPPSLLVQGASAFALGQLEQAYAAINRYVTAVPGDKPARKLMASIQMSLGRADEAYSTLQPLAGDKDSEKDAELLNLIARAALQKGDFENGRRYLEEALAAAPASSETMARLGLVNITAGNIDKGLEDLTKAVSLDPDSVEKRGLLALQLLRTKRTDDALTEARKLQTQAPERAIGFTLEGLALAVKGDDQAARKMMEKALAVEPGNPSASFNMVRYASAEKNWKEVRKLLDGVLKKYPRNERALLLLADLEREQGHLDDTLALLQRAVDARPEAREPAILMAQEYLRRGDATNAMAAARKVAPIYPNDPALLEVTGKAELAAGQPGSAAITFDKLAEVKSDDPVAHYMLADALAEQGNWVRADEVLGHALELAPKFTEARFARVRAKASLGQLAEAEQMLNALVAEKPKGMNITDLQTARGTIAIARKDYAVATPAFAAAFKAQKNSLNLRRLAEAEIRSGKIDAGLNHLDNWLKANPTDNETRFFHANQLLALNRLDAAAAAYEALISINPKSARGLNNLAWVKLQQKDLEKAAEYIQRALKIDSDSADIYDTAGTIYMALKRYRDAVTVYRKAMDLAPNSAPLRQSYARALVADGKKGEAREVLRDLLEGSYTLQDREKINQWYLQLSE